MRRCIRNEPLPKQSRNQNHEGGLKIR
jgi:hypothetical protein